MSARVSRFTHIALRRIGGAPHSHLPTASAIASDMEVSVRTLERDLHAECLPNPKELLNWLTLLYATLAADLAGLSLSAIARSRGWHPSDVYRLRHRLMDRSGASDLPDDQMPDCDFDCSLLAFLQRCGVPRQRMNEVLARAI